MAVTFEELIGSVRTTGAQQSKRDVDSVRDSFRTLGDMINSLGTLGGLTFLFSQLQELGRTLAQVSGVGIAAEFMGIARALTALTGSGEKANRFLEQFKRLGMQSAFDTTEVASMGARMLGAGVPEGRVVPELSALLDLASHGMGLSRQDFPEFTRNLLQIMGRGTGRADLADINQLKDRVPQIGSFIAAGLGGGIGRQEALKKAQSMTGKELYDTIIKGSQSMAKGAAAAKALNDPIAALGNIFETLRMTMAPTGAILLGILRPILSLGQRLASVLKAVNDATFGIYGLTLLIGGGMVAATKIATTGLWQLVTALTAVATSAKVTAATTATASSFSMSAAGLSGAAGIAVGGIGGAGLTRAGLMLAMKSVIKALPFIGTAAIGLELGGQAVKGDGKDPFRRIMGDLLSDMAFLGPTYAIIKGHLDQAFPGKTANDPMVKEQKKTNEILTDMRLSVWGGGPITARTISDFEAQYAAAAALKV